MPIVYRVSKKF